MSDEVSKKIADLALQPEQYENDGEKIKNRSCPKTAAV